ncbi:MAG: hypothetical protein QN163_01585 [Armatimonadota bacterium]|nr:hypothetical protein [Armatimonadota bacterium]MDR5696356.1 hypothetical protein [Armatimonadota bacterium]
MSARPIPLREAARRLEVAARDAGLQVDRRNVVFRPTPFPSYEYVLWRQQAHAVLCMPADRVEADDWRAALAEPMRRARAYLEPFVHIQERVDLAARGAPRFQQFLRV